MNTFHAALWSTPFDESRYRRPHQKRTKQHGQDEWTWEEILDGKGPWTRAGEYRRPREQMEAARAERRRYEELDQPRRKHERQPTQGDWRSQGLDLSQPRAYRGERVTGQAPCYAVMRTVSPVRIHSPVRSVPASCSCRARVGIQPGLIESAQRSWSPVRLYGPEYPATALRTVSPVRQHNPVRPVPAPRTSRATGGIQPGRVVPALSSRPPVRIHGPV